MSDFAVNLKKFRKKAGYSQAELANYLNFGSTAIANYESGRNEPSFDILIMLSDILGITPNELLGVSFCSEEWNFLFDYQKLSQEEQQLIMDFIKLLLRKNIS